MAQVKGINPGRLKRRVEIMRYRDAEDDLGNTISELVVYKTVWAEIRPARGTEQLEYYKATNSQQYKITIRYIDVTEKDVIRYRGRQFQINTITNPVEDCYYLELGCTESMDHAVKEAEHG